MQQSFKDIEAALIRMRELARSPAKRAEMETAWNTVLDQLEPFYLAMRPRPKSFEVHHMNETARARFAYALAAGHSMAECASLAVARVITS
jgi:hypothetical protein